MLKRMKTLPLPRYVEPASIDEGDTIRVTWKVDDVEISRTAKVDRIREDSRGKVFYSPNGNEICSVSRDNPRRIRFTLLAEAPAPKPEPLFDMEGV